MVTLPKPASRKIDGPGLADSLVILHGEMGLVDSPVRATGFIPLRFYRLFQQRPNADRRIPNIQLIGNVGIIRS